MQAVIEDDNVLGSSRMDQDTIRRNDVSRNYNEENDVTRASDLLSGGSYSEAQRRGRGHHDIDGYRQAARSDLPDGRGPPKSSDDFRNALIAAQVQRGLDPAREAERMSFPNGGFDHDIPANIRGSPYDDDVRNAGRHTITISYRVIRTLLIT